MAILPIITAPDPILKEKSLSVISVDDSIRKLMQDMKDTMNHDNGVGLAAVQVGVLKRVMVIDLKEDDDTPREADFYPLFMANPEFIYKSENLVTAAEGCLSLPEQTVEVERCDKIKLRYLDYNNNKCELEASGWLARALQHEIDHMDGKVLIDYLSFTKRDSALRKLTKLKKQNKAM